MKKIDNNQFRKAFSMIELIFVIAILGIVSSIGAEIIAQVYEGYVIQRASYRSGVKTELAATQIANRLAYAIPNTVVGRKSATDGTFASAENITTNDFEVLQWIGYDSDSFGSFNSNANRSPGWSGFADIQASTSTSISTPASKLNAITNTIIGNLSAGSKTISSTAIFFPSEYATTNIGYGGDSSGLHTVSGASNTAFTVPNMAGSSIKEHYKLAWSSYAIVPIVSARAGLHDLFLRYNFQPWSAGSNYQNAPSVLLLRNVSVFQFTASPTTIRFKICQREYVTNTYYIDSCKEKAVIR